MAEQDEIREAIRRLQAAGSPAAGDERDHELLFRHYYAGIRQFFANRPALKEDAQDLAQDTLWRAFERIGQFRFESSFHHWLRTIARSVWLNAWRRRCAEIQQTVEAVPQDAPGPRQEAEERRTTAPGEDILDLELSHVLAQALAPLPPGMRRAMELFLLEFKYQQIADILKVSLGTVRSQIHEARQRLKPALAPYFPNVFDTDETD